MENTSHPVTRIQARDAAINMLNRLTAAFAFAAVAGVGLLGVVSAHTIPGVSSSSTVSTTTSTATSSRSTGVQSSSSVVSSSSSSGVAVSGGS